MKIFLGYYIYQKRDMLPWLLDGIVENFDPETTELGFVFDKPTDGTAIAFSTMSSFWLKERGYKFSCVAAKHLPDYKPVTPFRWVEVQPEKEVREVGGHNWLLHQFMASDCDVMLAPQDDNRFNRPCHAELEKVLAYGPTLGMIGCRDGFNANYTDMAGSFWSNSNPGPAIRLRHGEFLPRTYFNSGPVAYPRHVVEQVGYLDEEFVAWCIWMDYGERCKRAGLQSICLGLDVTHAGFGAPPASWIYETVDGMVCGHAQHDQDLLKRKETA